MKRGILLVLVLSAAAFALGELSKYKDWAKSPEADFLTVSEREEWSKLQTDDEAQKFIASYWAKRGGDPFKQKIFRRIAAADQQFALRGRKGSESARGRVFIVLDRPTRVQTSRGTTTDGSLPETALSRPQSGPLGAEVSQSAMIQTWVYDKGHFDASWGIGELRIRFIVDPQRGTDEGGRDPGVERAIATVAEKSIVNPAGNPLVAAAPAGAPAAGVSAARPAGGAPAAAPPAGAPPAGRPATSAPSSAAAPPPPPAPVAANLPAAARTILEAAAKERKPPEGFFWGGAFRTQAGDPFYAFEISIPADRAGAGLKVGGVVTDEGGQEKAAFWEDATMTDSKVGSQASKVYTRSVPLPPGSYRASFALFPADGSAALVSATPEFKLEPKSETIEVSPLILTNVLVPLVRRAQPTEPFIFGRPEELIQIVPRANEIFTNQDSLWYFFSVRNPAKPAETAPSAPPAPGTPAAEVPGPRIMTTVSVLRNGKPAFKPETAPARLKPLGDDYYGEGKEIPLERFEPGYYTFLINIRDLNAPRDSAAFKGSERRADFTVLKADGSMPDRAVPTPLPAQAPAKKG